MLILNGGGGVGGGDYNHNVDNNSEDGHDNLDNDNDHVYSTMLSTIMVLQSQVVFIFLICFPIVADIALQNKRARKLALSPASVAAAATVLLLICEHRPFVPSPLSPANNACLQVQSGHHIL